MNDTHDFSSETFDPSPFGAAIAVFLLSTALGAAGGFLIGATRVTDSSGLFDDRWAAMTEQPLENVDKAFNWLIFLIFVAAGIVAATVAWASTAVVNNQLAHARYLARTAPRPPAPPAPPVA